MWVQALCIFHWRPCGPAGERRAYSCSRELSSHRPPRINSWTSRTCNLYTVYKTAKTQGHPLCLPGCKRQWPCFAGSGWMDVRDESFNEIHTKYILLALFGLWGRTPPTVLVLGPWNFHHSCTMVWGYTAREDFLIPPPQPAPGSKRCCQIRSGGPSAYFRASFAKYKLLGIVWGVI